MPPNIFSIAPGALLVVLLLRAIRCSVLERGCWSARQHDFVLDSDLVPPGWLFAEHALNLKWPSDE